MESSGECRGCQRNIKFAVKQARLCRTCYNKTYLTSQKRREYYKNKKKRREQHSTMPVEPAINVHHHRHHAIKSTIKKESTTETDGSWKSPSSSPLRSLPDNLLAHEVLLPHHCGHAIFIYCPRALAQTGQPSFSVANSWSLEIFWADALSCLQDPVAAHLYMLSYQSTQSHTHSSCSDCVPRESAASFASPAGGALSLAALAHASQQHALASSLPASPTKGGSIGSLHHHLSSSMPSSPSSSPSFSVQPPHQQLHMGVSSPPTASATSSLAPLSGSPPTATALLHDLLQQVATSYPAYYYATLAAAMPTEMFASTAATTSPRDSSPSSATLPSLSSFLLPSTHSLASPLRYSTPASSKAASYARVCQQCLAAPASTQRADTCDACLVASNRQLGEQAATRSPAIKNLLN
jgi:hypothetical protein